MRGGHGWLPSGGLRRPGYAHLLEVLADPQHEEHDGLRKWAGELPSFDREAAGLLVRQTVGAVPESVRLLLDLLAAGVKLTPGGRLPRSVVQAMQEPAGVADAGAELPPPVTSGYDRRGR